MENDDKLEHEPTSINETVDEVLNSGHERDISSESFILFAINILLIIAIWVELFYIALSINSTTEGHELSTEQDLQLPTTQSSYFSREDELNPRLQSKK